jgi:hypothetical protein
MRKAILKAAAETRMVVLARSAQPGSRYSRLLSRAWELDATLILRVGLAVLFGANAAVAWFDPANFTSLLTAAHFDEFVDPWVFIWMIRWNDLVAALALVFAWRRWPRFIPAWAGVYLLIVAAIKVAALI